MQLLLFLGMSFGLFLIATVVGVPVLSKITGVSFLEFQNSKGWDPSNPGYAFFMRGMILLQFLFLFTIPALFFSYVSDPNPMQYLGLKAPGSSLYWVFGILVMLVAFPFVEYIGYVNQKLVAGGGSEEWMRGMEEEATRQISFLMKDRTPAELAKNLVFIALFAGIGEELFFRGVLQRMFIRMTRNPWIGIILTAAIFSGIHFQFYGFLPRLFLGVLLGAIYWYSGSLWVSIVVHFLYDAVMVILIYAMPAMLKNPEATLIKGQDFQLLIGAMISLAITFVILQQMQKRSVTSYEEIYNDDFPKEKDDFSF